MDEKDDAVKVAAKRLLAATLLALGREYDEAVRELGRERHKAIGHEFHVSDFIAGACAIYQMVAEDDRLPWPAAGWVMELMGGGERLLWRGREEEAPKAGNEHRNEWLVIDVNRPVLDFGLSPNVVASFDDPWEASAFAEACNQRADTFKKFYLVVRVPHPGYRDDVNYPHLLALFEEE